MFSLYLRLIYMVSKFLALNKGYAPCYITISENFSNLSLTPAPQPSMLCEANNITWLVIPFGLLRKKVCLKSVNNEINTLHDL